MRFFLVISQSLEAIRSNLFRAGVTMFIIALGITALIIVMTSIEGVKTGLSSNFASLGSNTFTIQNWSAGIVRHGRGRDKKSYPAITYREAEEFSELFQQYGTSSKSLSGGGTFQVRYREEETNPNISLTGIDQNYFLTARYTISEGRSLSEEDIELARNVIIIGDEIKTKLFPFSSAVGKTVQAGSHSYTVVGVLESFGTMGMGGADKSCFIPITTLRSHYSSGGSVNLSVYVPEAGVMEETMAEAAGTFRIVRGLTPREEDNFAMGKSDQIVGQLLEQASTLTITAQIIALITLMGAAVALLNVMLVSVTERTREIGLRKATGATKKGILLQFLAEAVVICQLGGVLGILLGVLGGNLISSLAFDTSFVVPWAWVTIGVVACLLVGIAAGMYPAAKAAKVDPIESLRHV